MTRSGKKYRRKRDSNSGYSVLEADALTTGPTRRPIHGDFSGPSHISDFKTGTTVASLPSKLALQWLPCLQNWHYSGFPAFKTGTTVASLPSKLTLQWLPCLQNWHYSGFPAFKTGTTVASLPSKQQWLPCHAPGVTGAALGLAGPVLV